MNGDPAPVEAATSTNPTDDGDTSVATSSVARLVRIGDIATDDYYPYYVPQYESPPEGPEFTRIEELPEWLVAEADRRYGEQFGQEATGWLNAFWLSGAIIPFTNDAITIRATDADTFGANSFSGTNIQVAGVDEADLVETDGKFLYMIVDNELLIIDVRDAGSPSIASRVQLDSNPTGIYLSGDRLTLISDNQPSWMDGTLRPGTGIIPLVLPMNPIGWNTSPSIEVQVLDIADATSPQLVERTELDGRLVSSRMVDGQLRLVVQQQVNWSQLLPTLKRFSIGFDEATKQHELRYETRNEYLGRVFENLENLTLPGYRVLSAEDATVKDHSIVELEDLEGLLNAGFVSATTIATFDTLDSNAGPDATKSVYTNGVAEIYATGDNLYVFGNAVPSFTGSGISWRSYSSETSIWKFDFGKGKDAIKLSAEGKVDGRVTTQFAADEHEGHLRLVTTGRTWSSGQDLFVLKQVGKKLKTVGHISDIAPNENLHSVRFLGDQAFVVTFRKVDPLFAIDLSDPTDPVITGELKIPGFSDYLQPLEDGYLLGVGRGADETIGRFQELQLSIFDVNDLSDPQLAHRYSFGGGRSTQSEALREHHAVSYFPDSQTLAIPIYSGYQGGGFRFGVDNAAILETDESALQVFRVDTATGFDPIATIKHDSRIMRSLRIGEQLLVVSQDYVTVHDLDDPTTQLAILDLQVGSDTGLVELTAAITPESLTGLDRPADPTEGSPVDQGSTTRRSFAPVGREGYATHRGNYAPRASARFAVLDLATEQLDFDLDLELADELAVDLASAFVD